MERGVRLTTVDLASTKTGAGASAAIHALDEPSGFFKKLGRGVMAAMVGLAVLSSGALSTPAHADPPTSTSSTSAVRGPTQARIAHTLEARKAPDIHLGALGKTIGMTDQEILRSVTSATASAVVESEQRIDLGKGTLVIPKGATVSVYVDGYGMTAWLSKSATVEVDWLPDPRIERVRYSFTDNTFHVEASGLGPDALYSSLATDALNKALLPLLPDDLKRPGFDPRDLEHVKVVMDTLAAFSGPHTSRASSRKASPHLDAMPLGAWSVSLELSPTKAIHNDLGKGLSLDIPAGARMQLAIDTRRVDGEVRLDAVRLLAEDRDGPVIHRGEGLLTKLVLRSISVKANPPGSVDAYDVRATYDLGAEQGISGIIALFGAVVGASQGIAPKAGAAIALEKSGDVKLTAIRAEIDAAIQKLSDPIAKVIHGFHPAAPGTGLGRV
jgi:hypothetical protein